MYDPTDGCSGCGTLDAKHEPDCERLVQAVKDYAQEHYSEGGWDVIIETYDDDEIITELEKAGARSELQAIDAFRSRVSVWAERQADAKNSVF